MDGSLPEGGGRDREDPGCETGPKIFIASEGGSQSWNQKRKDTGTKQC